MPSTAEKTELPTNPITAVEAALTPEGLVAAINVAHERVTGTAPATQAHHIWTQHLRDLLAEQARLARAIPETVTRTRPIVRRFVPLADTGAVRPAR